MKLTPQETQKLNEFSERIGVQIQNLEYLKEALTHRSYINEVKDPGLKHNERLEFLGDAVLELLSTEFLFQKYPDRPEGELTSFRAALVRTESLAEEARKLGYGDYIYMSKGEAASGGRNRPYILANTFESVLGAIYLDQGIVACNEFLTTHLLPKIDYIVKNRLDVDSKSKLQEVAQEMMRMTPVYTVKSEVGPDHDKTFTMSVSIDGFAFGEGSGKSKQEAEQNAAEKALANWHALYKNYTESGKITHEPTVDTSDSAA